MYLPCDSHQDDPGQLVCCASVASLYLIQVLESAVCVVSEGTVSTKKLGEAVTDDNINASKIFLPG